MLVLKFGGSSVESSPQMLNVLTILKEDIHGYNTRRVVVLSACKNITDSLQAAAVQAANKHTAATGLNSVAWQTTWQQIRLHHVTIIEQTLSTQKEQALQKVSGLLTDLYNLLEGIFYLKELTVSTNDAVLAFGELLSTTIFYHLCLEAGLKSSFVDARDWLFTDANYGNAVPYILESERNIRLTVERILATGSDLIITQGFIASHNDGQFKKTTTLGRGGSDYAAAFIGAAVNAEEIQIWTDVNGILSADPRVCQRTKTISLMSFNEVKDLAFWGAKVIHPKTILPAVNKNINIKVLNSMEPVANGTVITARLQSDGFTAKSVIAKEDCVFLQASTAFLHDKEVTASAVLYHGSANGSHVILLDGQLLKAPRSAILDGAVPCSAICITGSNLKGSAKELGMLLAEVLNCLRDATVLQILYEFFDSSVVVVINKSSRLSAMVQSVHDSLLL